MAFDHHFHSRLMKTVAAVAVFTVFIVLQWAGLRAGYLKSPKSLETSTDSLARPEELTVVHSDEEVLIFELSPPEVELSPARTSLGQFEIVRLPGYGHMGIAGKPDLPQHGYLIALPPGSEPVLSVLRSNSYTIDEVTVLPGAEKRLVSSYDLQKLERVPNFETSYPVDPLTYGQITPFPEEIASIAKITRLRDQRVAHLVIRPVQVIPANGRVIIHTQLRLQLRFDYPNGRPEPTASRPESEPFEKILSDSIVNYEQALEWRDAPEPAALVATSPCMDSNSFRIAINESAIHEITHGQLAAQGFPATAPSDKIRMCYLDQEISIRVIDQGDGTFGDGDAIVFFGQAIKTQETETNIYWLTYSTNGANGLRMSEVSDGPVGITPGHYSPNIHLETDAQYYSLIPEADLNDHWYWAEPLVGEISNPASTMDIVFTMSNKAAGTYNFPIRVELWAWASYELHRFEVKLNGNSLGQGEFEGSYQVNPSHLFEVNAATSALNNGTNTITIVALDNDGNPNNIGHRMLVNWVEVLPRRQFVAQDDRLAFEQPSSGTWNYSISSFGGGTVEIYDVTDAPSPTYDAKTVTAGNILFSRSASNPTAYQLTTAAARVSPQAVEKETLPTPRLQSINNRADYIIITDPSLSSALTPLRSRRSSQGLEVKTVYVQDIFDEFSYGIYSPDAIKDFLAYAYGNWQSPAPTYGLLAGEGSYDHRNVLGLNDNGANLVPVFLRSGIDSWLGEAAADNQYVDFNGDDLAQMLLGRLPALNSTELDNMVSKTLAYETSGPSPDWQGDHLFVTDNGLAPPGCAQDPAADFFFEVDSFIAALFPDGHILRRLYYAPVDCYPVAEPYYAQTHGGMQSKLAQMYTGGNQFVVYTGHSGTKNWGHEDFLNVATASSLSNGSKTPIMLPMTCLEGIYHFPQGNNLSETLLKSTLGGSVASYAPTGLQVQTGHGYLISGIYSGIFEDNDQVLGQAIEKAKINLALNGSSSVQDLHDTFMLLGDPALRLNTLDEINQNFLPSAMLP